MTPGFLAFRNLNGDRRVTYGVDSSPRSKSADLGTSGGTIRPNIHDMRPKTIGRLAAADWDPDTELNACRVALAVRSCQDVEYSPIGGHYR
jgi:hypothetical protein